MRQTVVRWFVERSAGSHGSAGRQTGTAERQGAADRHERAPPVFTVGARHGLCRMYVLARHQSEGFFERLRLLGIELDHESTAAFQGDSHHKTAPLLRDFQRTVARPRLHRRHARTYPSSVSAETPPLVGARRRWRISYLRTIIA